MIIVGVKFCVQSPNEIVDFEQQKKMGINLAQNLENLLSVSFGQLLQFLFLLGISKPFHFGLQIWLIFGHDHFIRPAGDHAGQQFIIDGFLLFLLLTVFRMRFLFVEFKSGVHDEAFVLCEDASPKIRIVEFGFLIQLLI